MTTHTQTQQNEQLATDASSTDGTFGQWLQDPLGSIIAASIAAMGSLGVVLSGSWFIHLALN